MTDFFCIKKNGKPLYAPAILELKNEKWAKVKDGMTVNLPIIVPIKGKSWQQCKLIFGNMIANAVKQANEKGITVDRLMTFLLNNEKQKAVPLDKDFLHAFIYIICPTFSDDGEPITLRDMDTAQASRLFKVVQIFLGDIGIVIDDPPKIDK